MFSTVWFFKFWSSGVLLELILRVREAEAANEVHSVSVIVVYFLVICGNGVRIPFLSVV
jgi:hypothetical protein